MNREQKKTIVSEIHEKLINSQVVLFTDYRGLTAEDMNELRANFRKVGVDYRVVKNNLMKLASEDTDYSSAADSLVGPTGIIISKSDPVEASKVLVQYMKKFPNLEFKAGILRGRVIDESSINDMSKLPTRDVLLGMFVGSLNSMPTGLVQLLSGIKRKFVYALVAIKEAREA